MIEIIGGLAPYALVAIAILLLFGDAICGTWRELRKWRKNSHNSHL